MTLATSKYGLSAAPTQVAAAPADAAHPAGHVTAATTVGSLAENPAVWAVGIAAIMLGFIGVNATIREGNVRQHLQLGAA